MSYAPPPPLSPSHPHRKRLWPQICNHPRLAYSPAKERPCATAIHECGKFAVLGCMLVKLHDSGHRVLLISTMNSVLDLLGSYLDQCRIGVEQFQLSYVRIDHCTNLESRPVPSCSSKIVHSL